MITGKAALILAGLLSFLLVIGQGDKDIPAKYRINFTKDPREKDGLYIPKNLPDALVEMDKMLTSEFKKEFQASKESKLSSYHFSLGMWMRNNWGLWAGSRLYKSLAQEGLSHPDDMSGVLLKEYWLKLNKKPSQLKQQVSFYKRYWQVTMHPRDAKCPKDGTLISFKSSRSGTDKDGMPTEWHRGLCEKGHTWFWDFDHGFSEKKPN